MISDLANSDNLRATAPNISLAQNSRGPRSICAISSWRITIAAACICIAVFPLLADAQEDKAGTTIHSPRESCLCPNPSNWSECNEEADGQAGNYAMNSRDTETASESSHLRIDRRCLPPSVYSANLDSLTVTPELVRYGESVVIQWDASDHVLATVITDTFTSDYTSGSAVITPDASGKVILYFPDGTNTAPIIDNVTLTVQSTTLETSHRTWLSGASAALQAAVTCDLIIYQNAGEPLSYAVTRAKSKDANCLITLPVSQTVDSSYYIGLAPSSPETELYLISDVPTTV